MSRDDIKPSAWPVLPAGAGDALPHELQGPQVAAACSGRVSCPLDERRAFMSMLQGSGPSVDWSCDRHERAHGGPRRCRRGRGPVRRRSAYRANTSSTARSTRASAPIVPSVTRRGSSACARSSNAADGEFLAGELDSGGERIRDALRRLRHGRRLHVLRPRATGRAHRHRPRPRPRRGLLRVGLRDHSAAPTFAKAARELPARPPPTARLPVGVRAMNDADIDQLPDLEAFFPSWLDALRVSDPAHRSELSDPSWSAVHIFLLKEAVELARGSDGLGKLAKEKGHLHPGFYRAWISALRAESNYREALDAAMEGRHQCRGCRRTRGVERRPGRPRDLVRSP